jgi:hypothetical protein
MEIQTKQPTTKGIADCFTDDVYVHPITRNQGALAYLPSGHDRCQWSPGGTAILGTMSAATGGQYWLLDPLDGNLRAGPAPLHTCQHCWSVCDTELTPPDAISGGKRLHAERAVRLDRSRVPLTCCGRIAARGRSPRQGREGSLRHSPPKPDAGFRRLHH